MPVLLTRSPVEVALFVFGINLLRYVLFSVPAFLVFHRWTPKRALSRRLGPEPVGTEQVRREVFSSVVSLGIFGLTGVLMYALAALMRSRWPGCLLAGQP